MALAAVGADVVGHAVTLVTFAIIMLAVPVWP